LPLLLEDGALWGHMAKPNPHWQAFAGGATFAIFHGPHAYVSPRWYEKPADNVPTWNYAMVHAHGRPETLDEAGKRKALEMVLARFDPQAPTSEQKKQKLIGGIVAFRMPIARLDAKFKMSQNKTAGDRGGVIKHLRASGRADDAAVADWMSTHDATVSPLPTPVGRGSG
jgi:transcriptional regulator